MQEQSTLSDSRRLIAAEVLDLGRSLFDAVIEPGDEQTSEEDRYTVEEARVAADQFFVALRLLLGLDETAVRES